MLERLPRSVRIVEVGPRDGLQNEKNFVSTADKLQFIIKLLQAGLKEIEVTSFVRKEKIPQMGDATELVESLFSHPDSKPYLETHGRSLDLKVKLMALVPNGQGLENALKTPLRDIAVFTATSETFNQKNINASIEQSLEKIAAVVKEALKNKLRARAYISTVFGCPYEGAPSFDELVRQIQFLHQLGVSEISLGDTIGVAHPMMVRDVIAKLAKLNIPLSFYSFHFHDTRGMALANILTALEFGATSFDASAGGLGGCPYAKGATGNVATEDLYYLCESLGIETGINKEKLLAASKFILSVLKKVSTSKYYQSQIRH